MKLNNKELFDFFYEKEISVLYHANTVSTSITYFQQGGLLSRGAVENLKLFQTTQSSDEVDKILNVWNDVFIDTADLHSYFKRQNLYGPILFEFNVELILNEAYEIWVTKNNPIYWNQYTSNDNRYFQSVDELREKWDTIPRQKKMITIRNNETPILFDYLKKITVDDPRVVINENEMKIHLFNEAKNKIKGVTEGIPKINNKFIVRGCDYCYCRDNYLNQISSIDLKRLFL